MTRLREAQKPVPKQGSKTRETTPGDMIVVDMDIPWSGSTGAMWSGALSKSSSSGKTTSGGVMHICRHVRPNLVGSPFGLQIRKG